MKKAVVLLSGGLDSTTCLAYAIKEGYGITALTVEYGQKHSIEVFRAKTIAKKYGVENHLIINADISQWGGSSLTSDTSVQRPKKRISQVPSTYVPARNTILLSLALSLAEAKLIHDIYIGVNAVDYSGYPDCRPAFIKSFEATANVGTRDGVEGNRFKIHVPLLSMSKAEIIKLGMSLGVDYSLTHSCYNPTQSGTPCGKCDSCILRAKGFREAALNDPIT